MPISCHNSPLRKVAALKFYIPVCSFWHSHPRVTERGSADLHTGQGGCCGRQATTPLRTRVGTRRSAHSANTPAPATRKEREPPQLHASKDNQQTHEPANGKEDHHHIASTGHDRDGGWALVSHVSRLETNSKQPRAPQLTTITISPSISCSRTQSRVARGHQGTHT